MSGPVSTGMCASWFKSRLNIFLFVLTQPGHPSGVDNMSTSGSSGVNRNTTWCTATRLVSVVLLMSGRVLQRTNQHHSVATCGSGKDYSLFDRYTIFFWNSFITKVATWTSKIITLFIHYKLDIFAYLLHDRPVTYNVLCCFIVF